MDTSTKDQFIIELSHSYISTIAPEELPLFRTQSEAYLKQKTIREEKGKDEMLGFGVGEAVTFLTPVVLAVTSDVFDYLLEELKKNLKSEGSVAVSDLVKMLFKKMRAKVEDQQVPQGTQPGAQAAQQNLQEPPQGMQEAQEVLDHLPRRQEMLSEIHQLVIDKARQLKLSEAKANALANAIVADMVLSG